MEATRITIFAGHYGSGKTNIAVNYALHLKQHAEKVAVCDLDIVNPYFRTKDSADVLEQAGVRLIASPYANTNVDVPALPAEAYAVIDDKSTHAVLDVGGDDRGALALGRYAPSILKEGDFEMLLVVNRFRPLTRTPEEVLAVAREIEAAAGIRFTGIVNNSNLGTQTTAEDILSSLPYGEEVARITGLPLRFTTVRKDLLDAVKDKPTSFFPLTLQSWRPGTEA